MRAYTLALLADGPENPRDSCRLAALDRRLQAWKPPRNSWHPGRTFAHWLDRLADLPGKASEVLYVPWENFKWMEV